MLGGGKGWAGLCGGGHSTGQVDRRQIQTQTARAVERVVGGRDRESTVSEIILPFRLYPAPPRPLVGQLHTPLDLFHLSPSPRQPPPEPVHVSPSPPSDDEDDLAHNPPLALLDIPSISSPAGPEFWTAASDTASPLASIASSLEPMAATSADVSFAAWLSATCRPPGPRSGPLLRWRFRIWAYAPEALSWSR